MDDDSFGDLDVAQLPIRHPSAVAPRLFPKPTH